MGQFFFSIDLLVVKLVVWSTFANLLGKMKVMLKEKRGGIVSPSVISFKTRNYLTQCATSVRAGVNWNQ